MTARAAASHRWLSSTAGKPALAELTVILYRDSNNDGTPDGARIAFDTTDANGYYRFDNLIADHYIVEVVTPAGLGSTTDANQDPDDDVDNDDNGVIILPTVVRSHPITLGGAHRNPHRQRRSPQPEPGGRRSAQ